jgi:DNA-binding transcriptional MerR regulator
MSQQLSCELPQKLFYRIQEVSRITGIKPYVLRYWETEFSALKPEKGANDQRRYRPDDIELVVRIKKLLYDEKFTIAGARRHLEGATVAPPAPAAPRRRAAGPPEAPSCPNLGTIARGLNLVRRELIELQAFLAG